LTKRKEGKKGKEQNKRRISVGGRRELLNFQFQVKIDAKRAGLPKAKCSEKKKEKRGCLR